MAQRGQGHTLPSARRQSRSWSIEAGAAGRRRGGEAECRATGMGERQISACGLLMREPGSLS
jgi:hypothetical protein